MKRYISDSIRKKVKERAGHCCEYCRIHQDDFYFPFEIIPLTPIGHATEKLLNFNNPDRIILRQVLMLANRYTIKL